MPYQPDHKKLNTAFDLFTKTGVALIATSDQKGTPHLAAAGRLEMGQGRRISISEWFCPGTLVNITQNPRISVTIWDPQSDDGYQMVGRTAMVEDTAVLDGYSHTGETVHNIPQVKRKLTIDVEEILRFSRAPHSDLNE